MIGRSNVIVITAACLLLAATASLARGDGGTLRFSERRGDRQISVFTSPTPLRAGPVDVSVLVQAADSGATPSEEPITVHAWPIQHAQARTSAPATTEAATNKLLRAAQLEFSEPGTWRIEVTMPGSTNGPPIGFDVEVAEPPPAWLDLGLWIGWPLLAIGLFAVHQWLDHRRRGRPARSSGGILPPLPLDAAYSPAAKFAETNSLSFRAKTCRFANAGCAQQTGPPRARIFVVGSIN